MINILPLITNVVGIVTLILICAAILLVQLFTRPIDEVSTTAWALGMGVMPFGLIILSIMLTLIQAPDSNTLEIELYRLLENEWQAG